MKYNIPIINYLLFYYLSIIYIDFFINDNIMNIWLNYQYIAGIASLHSIYKYSKNIIIFISL
jgi:hypothetical protein